MTKPLHMGFTRFLLPCLLVFFILRPDGNLRAQNTAIVVRQGSSVNMTGGAIFLKDVDLHVDGQWQAAGGMLVFAGANPTSAGGNGSIQLWQVQMAKSQNVFLTLNTGLQIGNMLGFKRGLIDLNGQVLQLTDTARLSGETDSGRITSLHGGRVFAAAITANAPDRLDVGNLGAVLTSTANMGTLSVNRSPAPATGVGIGIQRTYLIVPQNNTGLNATFRFYYLNAELSGNDPTKLKLWKSEDGIAWALIGADSRDTAAHYVEKTGIADLSYWTLADLATPLPIKLVSFSAVCAGSYAIIEWKTGEESQLRDFVVQRSTDGTAWSTLGQLDAQNAANGASYSFKDAAPLSDCFYRLKIEDLDGNLTYSPIFRGGCSDIALPFLVYPNPAVSQAVAQISLRRASKGRVQVLNTAGGSVYEADWSLQTGLNQLVIPVIGWAPGTYWLRLVLPDGTQTAKFIKL
jgi:hypothetical protein